MSKFLPAVLLVAVLAGCASTAATGSAQIHGQAMGSSGVYGHARVLLNPGNHITTTDAGGNFVFTNLTAGTYTLRIEPLGAPAYESQVRIPDNNAEVDDMYMPS